MTKNLERIGPWWDRRVMGGLLVAVIPVTVIAAAAGSMPEVSVVKVALLLALWCLLGWAVRGQLVPSASVSASVLVVRNLYSTYEIPWQTLTGIDWEPRSGVLSLELADGQRVPVQAFSRWPSFGRHRKVIETLEEGRRLAAGPAEDEVRVIGASGITEFLLALCFGAALVALLVEGIIALV